MRKQQGFTLIEVTIVLLIIALVAGGIVAGRDMIRNAAIQSTIKQIQEYNSSVNAFKAKYNCLPGDCATITSYLPTDVNCALLYSLALSSTFPAGVCNGNGDGRITTNTTEGFEFWVMLNLADMVSEKTKYGVMSTYEMPGTTVPALKMRKTAGITPYYITTNNAGEPFFLRFGHAWRIGTFNPGTGSLARIALTPAEALQIDKKIDDGVAITGDVTANYTPVTYDCATAAGVYGNKNTLDPTSSPIVGCLMNIAVGF